MPHFALLDANRRVVNTVALARRDDILTAVTHGQGVEGDLAYADGHEDLLDAEHRKADGYGTPVFANSDEHLKAHAAEDVVEVTKATGRARVGMLFEDGRFVPGPEPLADASNADLVAEAQRRGLVGQPQA